MYTPVDISLFELFVVFWHVQCSLVLVFLVGFFEQPDSAIAPYVL